MSVSSICRRQALAARFSFSVASSSTTCRSRPLHSSAPLLSAKNRKIFKDDNIKYPRVWLPDAKTGQLQQTDIPTILASINRKTHFVQLVSVTPSPNSGKKEKPAPSPYSLVDEPFSSAPTSTLPKEEEIDPNDTAIVKIVSKAEAEEIRKRLKESSKKQKQNSTHKEIQLTWTMGEGDMMHKLARAKDDLAKGAKIDLVFTGKGKKGTPKLQRTDMTVIIEKALEQFEGRAMEYKPRTFDRQVAAVFLATNSAE